MYLNVAALQIGIAGPGTSRDQYAPIRDNGNEDNDNQSSSVVATNNNDVNSSVTEVVDDFEAFAERAVAGSTRTKTIFRIIVQKRFPKFEFKIID